MTFMTFGSVLFRSCFGSVGPQVAGFAVSLGKAQEPRLDSYADSAD